MTVKIYNFIKAKIKTYGNELTWIFLGLIIQLLAGVIGIKVLTKFLLPEEYGTLNLFNSLIQFFEIVVFSSLIQGASRNAYYTNFIWHPFNIIIKVCKKIFYFIASIFLLIGIYFILCNNFNYGFLIILAIPIIFFDISRDIFLSILHMNRNRKLVTIFRSSDQLFRVLIVFFLGTIVYISVINVFIGYLFVTIVITLFLYRKNIFHFENKISLSQNKELKNKIMSFAVPFSLLSIFTWIQTWADRWVLSSFLDLKSVGIYSSYSQLSNIPFMVLCSLTLTFYAPIIFKEVENIDNQITYTKFRKKIKIILFYYMIFSILSIFFLLIIKNSLLNLLLPHEFIQNTSIFIIVALGWLLFQFAQVQASLSLFTAGDSKYVLYANIISGVTYIVLLWLLVNRFGIKGAAYSFVIANFLRILFQYFFSFKAWSSYKMTKLF